MPPILCELEQHLQCGRLVRQFEQQPDEFEQQYGVALRLHFLTPRLRIVEEQG